MPDSRSNAAHQHSCGHECACAFESATLCVGCEVMRLYNWYPPNSVEIAELARERWPQSYRPKVVEASDGE